MRTAVQEQERRLPTALAVAYNRETNVYAFGASVAGSKVRKPEQVEHRSVAYAGERWYQEMAQEYQQERAENSLANRTVRHAPGNCAEWNTTRQVAGRSQTVYSMTMNTRTSAVMNWCDYCQTMVKNVIREYDGMVVHEYRDMEGKRRIHCWRDGTYHVEEYTGSQSSSGI
ncbi:hypothetical protein SCP_0401720 [Sparassis crispa]|uniref:Uncharacterized protein n=1 Tax=Sparassis crispa TaxID=139825 RepID=A0A401GI06_9APHY|nr:hypothetical protein SCP_0401720 [Sparassis crispa]GBE81799.1 hypothetical protein SCP_0401720 [Sparassis crispa]